MNKPKYFDTQELVSPEWYSLKGERAIEWISPVTLHQLDAIREYFNAPIIVNDWAWGGGLKNCGLRHYEHNPYSKTSYHLHGLAMDLHPQLMDINEMYDALVKKHNQFGITEMESRKITIDEAEGNGWIHVAFTCGDFRIVGV